MWSDVWPLEGVNEGAVGTERRRLLCRRVVDSWRRWVRGIGDGDAVVVLGFVAAVDVVVVAAPQRREPEMDAESGRIGRTRKMLLMLTDGAAGALAGG